jgi:hypothetical protein|tara:strand:+ start:198 stop:485 length:288 start_codon:yes stop_codon:yes gene_type:complete
MAIHKINLKEMNLVSNANTEGTWGNAFICYGPGPKGIEHEGIKYTYGSQDKILFCNVCGQSWGWQERLSADLNKIDQINDSKRGLFNNIKKQIDK